MGLESRKRTIVARIAVLIKMYRSDGQVLLRPSAFQRVSGVPPLGTKRPFISS